MLPEPIDFGTFLLITAADLLFVIILWSNTKYSSHFDCMCVFNYNQG
jgi:hypothetical protein